MGLIRFLLALAVIGAHSNAHQLLKLGGGEIAVQGFFIISGFYMAMVYKNYDSRTSFWTSRYLRLYPTYILCAVLSFFLLRGGWPAARAFFSGPLPFTGKLFLAFTNVTILFQDLTLFLSTNDGVLHFAKNFRNSSPPLYQFLWIQQGWTLGLELSFYMLVPFILNKSTKIIVSLIVLSIGTRVALQSLGFSGDPWSYRFFPSELSMFLFGSISFRIYEESSKNLSYESFNCLIFAVVVLYLVFFSFIPMEYQASKIIFYILLISSLGRIFELTKKSKIDNFIGTLSYPIYCSHLLVIDLLVTKMGLIADNGGFWNSVFIYTLIIIVSFAIYMGLERPVDIFRNKFKRRHRATLVRS